MKNYELLAIFKPNYIQTYQTQTQLNLSQLDSIAFDSLNSTFQTRLIIFELNQI